jgi:hypothetical protein
MSRPAKLAPCAAVFLPTLVVLMSPTDLGAQSARLTDRQARIENAIGTTEQLVSEVRARAAGQRTAPSSRCVSSEIALRDCLQSIRRDAALISDPAAARQIDGQLDFFVGHAGALLRGNNQANLSALESMLAVLRGEKEKILQQLSQGGAARRTTP